MLSKYNDYQSNIHNCQTPNNQCMTLCTMSNIWRCRMPTPPPSPQTLQQRCVIAAAMPPLSHANAAVAANPAPTPPQSLQQRHRCRANADAIASATPPLSHANAAVTANPAPTPPQLLQQHRRCRTPTLLVPQSLPQRCRNRCSNTATAARQHCHRRNPCANVAAIAAATPPLSHANANCHNCCRLTKPVPATAAQTPPSPPLPQSLR